MPAEKLEGAEEWMAEVEQEIYWLTAPMGPKLTMPRISCLQTLTEAKRADMMGLTQMEIDDHKYMLKLARKKGLVEESDWSSEEEARPVSPLGSRRAVRSTVPARQSSRHPLTPPSMGVCQGPASGVKRRRTDYELEVSENKAGDRTKNTIQTLAKKVKRARHQRQQIEELRASIQMYTDKKAVLGNRLAEKAETLDRRRDLGADLCLAEIAERSLQMDVLEKEEPMASGSQHPDACVAKEDVREDNEIGVLQGTPAL
ncbi:hypothetical protein BDY19DRAFT_963465 [Irpex rosettiformis]|uniref:Uncharacterized protein n=1 Tax=Irpex rosettiformis TaxID=378272 RepID=A0ACB8TV73_9APHY|nr:hypothetical protein BDY19DRAFT_963465 [Irpex rosettiformis]